MPHVSFTVSNSAIGVILIKEKQKAIEDGNYIYATILGSAINQDGKSNGLTALNLNSQVKVINKAMKNAKVSADDITYVEAHGTGTNLGDPIEVSALAEAICEKKSTTLKIGSVKTNIGHLEAAAGIASLIKVSLCLNHKKLVPSLNYAQINKKISLADGKIAVQTSLEPWKSNGRRTAGISSFGFGGTNAHAVLAEFDSKKLISLEQSEDMSSVGLVMPVSAKCPESLKKNEEKAVQFVGAHADCARNIARAYATGRSHFEQRAAFLLDANGEVLLTILSSLAQDESRSISENCTWGIRRRFETGKHKMSTKRFLGYDTDETGKLVINRTQEPIVVRLYQEFLDGKTTDYIKRIFEREGVKNWDGGTKWQSTTLMSMLENEKYKGDALLQKSYTVDFLTKKRTQNKGEIQMFYVEDDHDAIISKRIWECVQLEIKRRKKYLEEHGTNSYSHRPESNPFASKIICGDCNKVFARKGWRSSTGVDRKVWQCSERYKVKGVMGCANRHVEEETLIKAYLMAWNALVENREDFMDQWTEQLQSENLLEGYRAEKFIEYTDGAEPLTEMDTDFMLKTLDHIKVFEDGTLLVVFLDGTEIECKNEEE